ncbi:hypothetical protein [Vulcanisaeta souniana]|uniref:Uncharacterized protein n=1 Tax=Vulcanisaeta souniana JCM 11219 TaxID=1293586 RepID=A0A830EBH4_9CREN|nr:hypothetical protein [Vulcanisaeta souniana]BDR92537.1 hypothetical protein Vsou_16300 [Vulcanisaeta souniana JCM 11219]GGI83074.1 hypothetical protein GCM10007112_19840 [Vulcanisaeta souniana JCM 11219]
MNRFGKQLGEIIRSIGLVLSVQVTSIIIIDVTVSLLIHYILVYISLMMVVMVILTTTLMVLYRMLSGIKELYLTRIRDAVWAHRAALDVNRESRELWIRARLYVIALLIIAITSLSSMIYSLINSLDLALSYGIITWINLTLLTILSLMEIYVIAKIDCAVWI